MTDAKLGGGEVSAPLPGGEELGPLLDATRRLLDAVAGSVAPPAAIRAATWSVIAACESLEPFPVAEAFAAAGERPDLPGHGHPGRVPHVEAEGDDLTARGRVTFTRAHLGGAGAAHGGSISLLFDDLLGRQAVRRSDQSPPRTAYLHVDYRKLTPVGVPLTTRTRIEQVEGRKIVVHGLLRLGPEVLAEARALFLMAQPVRPHVTDVG